MANTDGTLVAETNQMLIEAKRVLEDAGRHPSDADYNELLPIARLNRMGSKDHESNIKEILLLVRLTREERELEAKYHVKHLRHGFQLVSERRARIDRLQEKLHKMELKVEDSQSRDWYGDGDKMEHERARKDLEDRIKLETDCMERDKAFVKKLTEKLAGDVDGL